MRACFLLLGATGVVAFSPFCAPSTRCRQAKIGGRLRRDTWLAAGEGGVAVPVKPADPTNLETPSERLATSLWELQNGIIGAPAPQTSPPDYESAVWSRDPATISLRDVTVLVGRSNPFFPSERTRALSAVSLELRGQLGPVAVVGDSGSGKSMLLKVINGCEAPTSGTVTVDGTRERVYLTRWFQVPNRGRTVAENIRQLANAGIAAATAAAASRGEEPPRSGVDVEAAVQGILRLTQLETRGSTPAQDLSGSDVVLLGLALALARSVWAPDPPVLLLDEMLDKEDSRVRQRVEGVLKRIAETGIRVLTCTHNMEHALATADAVVVMSGGACVQTDAPQETAYIRSFYERLGSRNAFGL